MFKITYSGLQSEAQSYWDWSIAHPIPPVSPGVAKEGAGSELRSPLFHYGTVLPVYLAIIRYLKKLPSTRGLKLVELGSGTGRVLAYMQSLFPYLSITGADYSAPCTDYARQTYGQYGITFLHDSAQKTKLRSNSMDIVISSHVIEHIKAQDGYKFVTESRRLLKSGGVVFVGTPERRKSQNVYMINPSDARKYRLVPPHEHEYTYDELKDMSAEIFGAKNVRVDKLVNPLFYSLFSTSIAKFRPGKFGNVVYTVARDYIPKLWFDKLTKMGANLSMRVKGIEYSDILMANKILPGTAKIICDNLLLVAQK